MDLIDYILELDKRRRELEQEANELRRLMNLQSRILGAAKLGRKPTVAEQEGALLIARYMPGS